MKNLNDLIVLMIHKISYDKVRVSTGGVEIGFCLFVVVVANVSLSIQLNPRAHDVSGPRREPHRRYKSELRSIKPESPHCTIEAPHTVLYILYCSIHSISYILYSMFSSPL